MRLFTGRAILREGIALDFASRIPVPTQNRRFLRACTLPQVKIDRVSNSWQTGNPESYVGIGCLARGLFHT